MHATNTLAGLIKEASGRTTHSRLSSLHDCLHFITHLLKMSIDDSQLPASINLDNINDFARWTNLLAYKIDPQAFKAAEYTLMPLLLRVTSSSDYYIFYRNKVYHPDTGSFHCAFPLPSTIYEAWQFIPLNIPPSTHVLDTIRSIFSVHSYTCVKLFIMGLILSLITPSVAILTNYLCSNLQESTTISLGFSILLVIMCSAVIMLFAYIYDACLRALSLSVETRLMPSLWLRLLYNSADSTTHLPTATMVQRMMNYEQAMASCILTIFSFILTSASLILLFISLMVINYQLALILLLTTTIFISLKCLFVPKQIRCMIEWMRKHAALMSFCNEILLQINKIRSANRMTVIYQHWFSRWLAVRHCLYQSTLVEVVNTLVDISIPAVMMLLLMCYLYFTGSHHHPAFIIQFMICISQITPLLDKIAVCFSQIVRLIPATTELHDICTRNLSSDTNKKIVQSVNGAITIKNVCFKHLSFDEYILNNINIDIEPGSFVGFIGPSGVGKSTLFKLILGLLQPDKGDILIDNERIRHLDLPSLRKHIGSVLQGTSLFPGTILSNLSSHTPLTIDDAWNLASMVGLDNDIKAMPMQMFTYISDNAEESLSGGQKQKILLARALSTKPRILLLDEATSALDNHSQMIVYKTLASLNMTRLVIAHRHSTLIGADCVYRLEGGNISSLLNQR